MKDKPGEAKLFQVSPCCSVSNFTTDAKIRFCCHFKVSITYLGQWMPVAISRVLLDRIREKFRSYYGRRCSAPAERSRLQASSNSRRRSIFKGNGKPLICLRVCFSVFKDIVKKLKKLVEIFYREPKVSFCKKLVQPTYGFLCKW